MPSHVACGRRRRLSLAHLTVIGSTRSFIITPPKSTLAVVHGSAVRSPLVDAGRSRNEQPLSWKMPIECGLSISYASRYTGAINDVIGPPAHRGYAGCSMSPANGVTAAQCPSGRECDNQRLGDESRDAEVPGRSTNVSVKSKAYDRFQVFSGNRFDFLGFMEGLLTDIDHNVRTSRRNCLKHPLDRSTCISLTEPSARSTANPPKTSKTTPKPKTTIQLRRRRVAHRAASARYREKNREKVLEADRIRAAERRCAERNDQDARARAREASARYRAQNRETLASKQREVRKRAYIKKHGTQAYVYKKYSDKPAQPVIPDDDDDGTVEGGPESVAPEVDEHQLSPSPGGYFWEDPFLRWPLD
ncbi:hypothetical protein B0H16DRAFT_1477503 [Mycena metata]|uniref:BZIP domain-containing protein n=1 Tax=Mycena metata TaxID=1033252 RepID=A0AAD7HAF5_9AGAR|nr:hypothetical protein B0H16DRAFT_1477503 [Mycena metata]